VTHSGKTYVTATRGLCNFWPLASQTIITFTANWFLETPTFKVRAKCEQTCIWFLHSLQFPAVAIVGQLGKFPHLAATKIKTTGSITVGFHVATLARFPDFRRSVEARTANEAANRSPRAEIASVSPRGVAGGPSCGGGRFCCAGHVPLPRN